MKKILFPVALLFILVLNSCKEVDKLLTFNIKNDATITIPANVIQLNTPFPIPTPNIQTNSHQEFANNKTTKDLVKDVKLTALSLEIMNPPNTNFSFLKSIKIYISADGVSEKLLAYLDNVPQNVTNKLDLLVTNEKLDEYIKKDTYNIRTEVVTNKAVANEIEIKARMNFRVTADVL